MFVVKHKNTFLGISAALVLAAVISIVTFGLNLGIDFTGGSILEATYDDTRPPMSVIEENVSAVDIEEVNVQPTGEHGIIARTSTLTEEKRRELVEALRGGDEYALTVDRFNSIGPTIGKELRSKAWIAITAVVIAIILFIAYVFRHVAVTVSSWKYGLIAIGALIHDIIIPTGIFAALGYEITTLFVIAVLAIFGLSVNDTIVVFDRIRENLRRKVSDSFREAVGMSLRQTIPRSINTSLTTLLVLLALYFLGPASTEHFALALALGIFFGTYSSIFLASPLLLSVAQTDEVVLPEEREEENKSTS